MDRITRAKTEEQVGLSKIVSGEVIPHLHVVGMLQFVFDINQPSLPTLFYSVPVSISVFRALLFAFHSINSPNNSLLSHSVLLALFLPYWSFQLYYISL